MAGPAENKAALELAVTWKARVWLASSTGAVDKLVAQFSTVCTPASSFTVWSEPFVNDGASFEELTVSVNVFTSGPPVRFTVIVISVVPKRFAVGLIVTTPVLPASIARKWSESFGTSVVLLEVPVIDVIVLVSPALKETINCVSSFVAVSGR